MEFDLFAEDYKCIHLSNKLVIFCLHFVLAFVLIPMKAFVVVLISAFRL